MTPGRLRYLRIKIQNKLWRRFPTASAIDIGLAAEEILSVVLFEPTLIVSVDHNDPDCCCWDCLLALNAAVVITSARLRVDEEAAGEFD